MRPVQSAPKPWGKLAVSAAASLACYILLFANEREVMAYFTRTDGFYPALPVITAFLFSFAHGAFTGYFWEVIGIRAKPAEKERVEAATNEAED